jgi:PAS domain S-box-containing protein
MRPDMLHRQNKVWRFDQGKARVRQEDARMPTQTKTFEQVMEENKRLQQRVAELEQAQASAETARKECYDLLTFVIKHNPNAISIFDKDLRYMLVSDRYLHDYGLGDQDIIGKHHYEVFPEMPQRWKEVHARCLAGAIESSDEDAFEREDGSTTYNRWDCRPWYDAHGNIGGITIFTEVITERKQAEQELRRSQALLQGFIENIPSVAYATDRDGKNLLVNKHWGAATGVDPEYALGKTNSELFGPEIAEYWQSVAQHIFETGQAIQQEETFPQEDGLHTYLTLRFPIRDMQGQIYAVGGISTDITERKKTEDDLRTFQTLVENAPDGIALINMDEHITYANTALKEMTGHGDTLIGAHYSKLQGRVDEELIREITQELEKNGIWQGTATQVRADGTAYPVQSSTFLMYDDAGQPMVSGVVIRDISEQQRQEEERQRLQEQVIEAQRATLLELSTPLIPVSEDVVIMPLVGAIDSGRAQMVMESLLEGVATNRANVAIVDITGVSVVDTQVAQALVSAAQAVRLLGAQVLLTGIGPQVAQTLVHLGVDMSSIITRSSLQSGIAYAIRGQ